MSRSSLPPGFRFHPTDIELVSYYLKRKVMGKPFGFEAISEVELYKYAPWDLPDKSCLKSKDLEWYFFCPRDRKYANGSRTNRATDIGYWKTTGKDRHIIYKSQTVGMKRTLVFHIGKAPRGDRTDWVMHEYRLENNDWGNASLSQDAYVICKIFEKSGPGPKNGEQHGAPFNEEDWDDDKAFENAFSIPLLTSLTQDPLVNQSIALGPAHQPKASEIGVVYSMPNFLETDGIFLDQLEEILNSSPLHSGNPNDEANIDGICAVDMEGIYDELEDLCCQTAPEPTGVIHLSDDINNQSALQSMISELNCDHYMELNDLCFIDESDPLTVLDDLDAHDPFPPYSIGNTNFFEDISAAAIGSRHLSSCPDVFNNQSHLIPEMDASEGMHGSDALSDLLDLGGG